MVATYATYLTYVAVSANPATTHPATASADGDGLGVALGLGVSFLALGGTVYFSSASMTAVMVRIGLRSLSHDFHEYPACRNSHSCFKCFNLETNFTLRSDL